jgi:predicted hotdog family 3-hydroxylacyl-ACP dehydratase
MISGQKHNIIASGNAAIALIPQKPPFVMVDSLVAADDLSATSLFTVKEENIFTENGFFREPGLIENIAQTAALKMGYECSVQNIPMPAGFIGDVKDLKIFSLPKIGDTVETNIKIEGQVMGVTIISGKIILNNELIVSCFMKIFVKTD